MSDMLTLALPSKGRMREAALGAFAQAGLEVQRTGSERGYAGVIPALPSVDVQFLSASEIAVHIRSGMVHLGVTGEDLIREKIFNADETVEFIKKLGFGTASVVVAVPACWIDVSEMADLEDVAETFRHKHGRRMQVATKYMNLTRRFFATHGVTSYRIVESLGATEGTPAAGTAEMVVDITSSGATLGANGLKVLDDGIILESEANLAAARNASWTPELNAVLNEIIERFGA